MNLKVKDDGVGGKYSKPGRFDSFTSTPNVKSNLHSLDEISSKGMDGKRPFRRVVASLQLDHLI